MDLCALPETIPMTGTQMPDPSRGSALIAEGGLVADEQVWVGATDSPFGPLFLAVTVRGVVRVGLPNQSSEALVDELTAALGAQVIESSAAVQAAARQVEEYFEGGRQRFDLELDLRLVDGFRRQVVEYLPNITFGEVASYGDVASALDNPKAMRAVGGACAHNPVPLILPCHRVVRSDGSIGQYGGGTDMKRWLLDFER